MKPCNTTRIKARNFLSNISYNDLTEEDFFNRSFVFDVYVLLIKNLNPFSTERKIQDQMSQGVLYMLWNECVSSEFFKRICKKDNFNYLNGKNALHPKTIEIIWKFIEKNVENYKPWRDYFQKYKFICQYEYRKVYPDICSST